MLDCFFVSFRSHIRHDHCLYTVRLSLFRFVHWLRSHVNILTSLILMKLDIFNYSLWCRRSGESLYLLLGLQKNATLDEIKKSYRKVSTFNPKQPSLTWHITPSMRHVFSSSPTATYRLTSTCCIIICITSVNIKYTYYWFTRFIMRLFYWNTIQFLTIVFPFYSVVKRCVISKMLDMRPLYTDLVPAWPSKRGNAWILHSSMQAVLSLVTSMTSLIFSSPVSSSWE